MRFLRGRDRGGEEEDKYHSQSKEARNVDSLLSLKVSFADFYVCDCFETTVSTSCQNSSGICLLRPGAWNLHLGKHLYLYCMLSLQITDSTTVVPVGLRGRENPELPTGWSSICQTLF